MELKPLKTIQGLKDPILRAINFVTQWVNQINSQALVGCYATNSSGSVNVTIGTTNTAINHTLGQVPNGWEIVDKTASSNVWRSSWDNKTIVLVASSTVTVKVWVF